MENLSQEELSLLSGGHNSKKYTFNDLLLTSDKIINLKKDFEIESSPSIKDNLQKSMYGQMKKYNEIKKQIKSFSNDSYEF